MCSCREVHVRNFIFAVMVAVAATSVPAEACYSCGNGVNAGQWSQRCPSSQVLWDKMEACEKGPGGCPSCDPYWAQYDACVSGSDPTCAPDYAGDACSFCIYGACPADVQACSEDTTGCVSCSAWLDGGDSDNLCPLSIHPAIDLSDCACSSCAFACGGACTKGYLDTTMATFACGACLGRAACGAKLTACAGS
jgi:hypothetical protein